jgi:hypothetical protein
VSFIFSTLRVIQLHLFVIFHTPSVKQQKNDTVFPWGIDNNRQMKLNSPRCIDNNRKMKLFYTGCMENNTASFVCYCPYTQGIQLHLSVIVYPTVEYSFICLLLSFPQGNTVSFVCYCLCTQGIDNNRQMKVYYHECIDNNRQMKLYSPGYMDNNRQMKL